MLRKLRIVRCVDPTVTTLVLLVIGLGAGSHSFFCDIILTAHVTLICQILATLVL
jgi:hypothetical protein